MALLGNRFYYFIIILHNSDIMKVKVNFLLIVSFLIPLILMSNFNILKNNNYDQNLVIEEIEIPWKYGYSSDGENSFKTPQKIQNVIDGTINVGEYSFTEIIVSGTFELHYTIDLVTSSITVGVKALNTGWVAIGFGAIEANRMDGADIVIGYVSSGTTYIRDDIGDGGTGHLADISNGGSNDISAFAGSETGGWTTIEFKRQLDTGDTSSDNIITAEQATTIIWAHHSSDSFTNKHSNSARGFYSLTFKATTVPDEPTGLTSSSGNEQVFLSWTAPANNGGSSISNYTIFQGITPGGATTNIGITTGTTYTATSLTNGQLYYFAVSATNSIDEGAKSSETSETPSTIPSTPSGLIATSGNSEISLSWTIPNNGGNPISSYKIYRSLISGSGFSSIGTNTTNSYIDSGLANGDTYYYKVSAINSNGEGAQSSEASATPAAPPSAPQSMSAKYGNQNITLSWSAPASNNGANVTGYNIYRSTTSGSGFSKIDTSLTLNYIDLSLSNGQTYFYKVSANNSIGEGGFSNEASSTPSTIPDIPTGLFKTVENAQVNLTWIAPNNGGSGITSYKIYRSSSTGGPYSLIGTSSITLYVDNGLINGNEYFYVISALNINGEGLKSSEISAIPVTTPGFPQSLTASSGNQQIGLTWTTPLLNGGSAITGYNIYRSLSSGSGFTKIGTSMGLSYTDSNGLTNGVVYYYKVTANNTIGEGTYSNEASSVPSTIPEAPQSLSVVSGDNSAILSWSTPSSDGGSAITSYKIYRGDASGGPYTLISTSSLTNFTDTNVQNGDVYFWVVTAVNVKGEGTESAEISTLVATTPGITTGLVAISGNNSISLSWDVPNSNGGSTITNYTIYKSATSGSGFTFLTTSVSTSYVDNTALNGQAYYYKVTANNSIGEGGFSNEASATPSTLPGAPFISNIAVGDGYVIVNWTAPSDDGGSNITA
ncbi:MAG: Amylopullulanase precursor [Candidatus Heimdallarchaeota archaeon LC_3]|nr:MAG: Amylopullulanase precursor [Candidatus Heimdallarchaeota archaeon LC_3]